jgi:hypothetical protein
MKFKAILSERQKSDRTALLMSPCTATTSCFGLKTTPSAERFHGFQLSQAVGLPDVCLISAEVREACDKF